MRPETPKKKYFLLEKQVFMMGSPKMWKLGNLSDCPGFHGIHRESRIALRTNAENRTISLYTCRGNQIHILEHCEISPKGVYS